MNPDLEKIKKKFAGKLIGSGRMQKLVCETIQILPQEIADFICKNVWFVSSFDDSWGFVLDSNDLGKKHLVFLGDELFEQKKYNQHYTIAHEIGHVMLKHKNAILEPQTVNQTRKQESEAHKLAMQYMVDR